MNGYRATRAAALLSSLLWLAACGGGGGADTGTSGNNGGNGGNGGTPSPSPATYPVGGSVSGLAGSGLVLQNNGADDLAVAASGGFTFASALAAGAAYSVTVRSQPSGQICTVANGSGTVGSGPVIGVSVNCATAASVPVLALAPLRGSAFHFTWADVAGETEYRLQEDRDGHSGYTTVATLAAGTTSHDLVVPLLDRLSALYRLQACNAAGCVASNVVAAAPAVSGAVGFVKASNTDIGDLFGSSVAISADGSVLAVGAPMEDSAATGIGGAQNSFGASDSGAVYVYGRSSGIWAVQAYVKASNTGAGDHFGSKVVLSADGSTMAVAAVDEGSAARGVNGDQASNGAARSGAVYVFVRSGGSWSQQAYLKASNTVGGAAFGSSLALSADGAVLAVGAMDEYSNATGIDGDQSNTQAAASGAVYVFQRSGTAWAQQAYVKAHNTFSNALFGYSVALAADGATLAVGSPGEECTCTGIDPSPVNHLASDVGAAYVFTRSGTRWSQQSYIKASNAERQDTFGWSVSLTADGNLLAVGAIGESSAVGGVGGDPASNASFFSGAAYVFARSGATWSQQSYLKAAAPGAGDSFGWAVALSADGSRLAVSAFYEASNASGIDGDVTNNLAADSGAVYVFGRSGTSWVQQHYLKPLATDFGDAFGIDLAYSADGAWLAIGTPGDDSGGEPTINDVSGSGAVHVY